MLGLMFVPVMGQEDAIDPSDLMQTINYLEVSYEYQELNYGPLNGGIDILRLEYDWAQNGLSESLSAVTLFRS